MYTAKIFDKSLVNGILRVQVEFNNGVESIFDSCTPSDEFGLKFWIKSRLTQLNSAPVIDATFPNGQVVDVSDPIVVPVVQTPEEIAADKWMKQYTKWVKSKTTLIDTGILTGNETKVAALKAKVQADYLPAYLDNIL